MCLTVINMEDYFTNLAQREKRPSVILCDRGLMDAKAYAGDHEVWQMLLDETGWNEATLREKRYDGVLHLVTAADGAEAFYSNENNEARSEDKNVALWIDHNLRKAWNGHPIFRIIGNDETGLEGKVLNAWAHVSTMIGLPATKGYYRKFLIDPNIEFPEEMNKLVFDIEENYLKSQDAHKEIRLIKSVKNHLALAAHLGCLLVCLMLEGGVFMDLMLCGCIGLIRDFKRETMVHTLTHTP